MKASVASSSAVSALADGPTLGEPEIAGGEQFRCLSELKLGELELTSFGGFESGKSVFPHFFFTHVHQAASRATTE